MRLKGALWALDIDPANLSSPITPAWSIPYQGPSGASPVCSGNNVYFDGAGYQPGDDSGTTIFGIQDNGTSGTVLFHASLGAGSGKVTCNFALDPRQAGGFWHQLQYDPNIYHRDGTTGNLVESINVSDLLTANGAPPGTYWMRGVFTTYGTADRPYMFLSESDTSYIASYLAMVDLTNRALVWAPPFYPANSPLSTDTPEGATALVMDSHNNPVIAIAGANTGAYFITNGPGTLVVSTDSLTLGKSAVGVQSAPQPVTLTNNSSALVHIDGIGTSGDFTQANNCTAPLAPGTNCTVTIAFNPSATGSRTGALRRAGDAAGSPRTIALSGLGITGLPAIGVSPPTLNFPGQPVGTTSAPQTVSLTHTGTSNLTLNAITASGDAVLNNNCPTNLAPAGSCVIKVMFAPAGTGARSGAVTVSGNAPNSPQPVALTGTGLSISGAAASLSSTSLVFPPHSLGGAGSAQSVQLKNVGTAALNISGIAASGDPAQSNDCGTTLAPGGYCTIDVSFTPSGAGVRAGSVSVNDDAGGPQVVGIVGMALGNPMPLLHPTLVPASQFPAIPDFTLAVAGGNFIPGAVVTWNGAPLSTNFLSSTRLSASVPAASVAVASTARIRVQNPGPGGGMSNPPWFPVGSPSSTVNLTRTDIAGSGGPQTLAVADFNGDGRPDLAVANSAANSVSILLGDGDGAFAPKLDYATGAQPRAIAAGDWNGDGRMDLAIVNQGDSTVSAMLGMGDGSFAPAATFATGTNPVAIAADDFDADGSLDLATANQPDNTISILHGRGDGTFDAHVDYYSGPLPRALVAGDFNQDGKLDLAVANGYPGGTVSVLLGNGDATVQPPTSYPSGDSVALAAADFNGDGILDLAAVSQVSQGLSVLCGNGDGLFSRLSTARWR